MALKKQQIYKIRHKETGLYSRGGLATGNDLWSTVGKTWTNIGHVKNHLRHHMSRGKLNGTYPYDRAEIVSWEIKYEECESADVNILANAMLAGD